MEQILDQETAYYIFDMSVVQERIAYLRKLLGDNVALAYAVKANPFIAEDMIPWVERFEICSPGEAWICDRVGVPTEKTVISGVYKTPSVIEQMVAESDDRIYTVESMTQFALLKGLSETYRKKLPILLRLTNDSQFGINRSEIEEIVASWEQYPNLQIQGIQFFSGTQKTSLKRLKREITKLDELLLHLEAEYGFHSPELEYGTGFPVAYFEGESLDEEALISGFAELLNGMTFRCPVVLELGRSIAASCGKYYTHIVDKKTNKGQNYLLMDGGMHHIVYFGQHMAMNQPVLNVCGKEGQKVNVPWNICGSLCSMNDIMAKQVPLPEVEIGDTICFHNTGAYCMTEGISLFLSRELPAVYLKKTDGTLSCVRRSMETAQWNSSK